MFSTSFDIVTIIYCSLFVLVIAAEFRFYYSANQLISKPPELVREILFNILSTNHTKWSKTLKQFVDQLPTNCLSVFDHFLGLAFKGLILDVKFGDNPYSLIYILLLVLANLSEAARANKNMVSIQ